MGLGTRMTNGWQVAKNSLAVLNAHKELIIFPVLSGLSMLLVIGSFLSVVYGAFGWAQVDTDKYSSGTIYLFLFCFYIVNYFIVVFFNMGLVHCAKLYFDGEEVSVAKGLRFSAGRIHYIFLWAVFAATVGTALRFIQDNVGWLGKIIVGIVGIVWSAATFFVIPILAYENVGPAEALKRSANLMKQKWGEGITANFSLGLISFCAILLVAVGGMAISALVNETAGVLIMVAGILFIITISSALHTILISALYNQVNGDLNEHFNSQLLDDLFVEK